MTAPAKELHGAIHAILTGDAALMSLVEGIHDRIPKETEFPYISYGAVTALQLDASCITASEITMQLHVWSRAVGTTECHDIADAAKRALHYATPETTDNALVEIRVPAVRVLDDPDGLTHHGILTVTARIEER